MNKIESIDTEYIRGSRTVETVLVSNNNVRKVFYVYNYEGNSFRLFEGQLDFINFFQGKAESDYHFNTEKKLDNFLAQIDLKE